MKKHIDTSTEQTKSRPQETLDFKLKKPWEIFTFSLPINLSEEGKWLLAAASFGATNSVFNLSHENKSCSISTPGYWTSSDGEETIKN